MQLAGPDGDHSGHDRCTMQMRTLRHVAIAAFAVFFVLLFIRAQVALGDKDQDTEPRYDTYLECLEHETVEYCDNLFFPDPTATPTPTPTATATPRPTGELRVSHSSIEVGRGIIAEGYNLNPPGVAADITATSPLQRTRCPRSTGEDDDAGRQDPPAEVTRRFWGCGEGTSTVTLKSGSRTLATKTVTVTDPNIPPTVSIETSGGTVDGGDVVSLDATASDPDGDSLTYRWSGSGSFANSSALDTTWTAPAAQSSDRAYSLTIRVSDGSLSDTASVSFTVRKSIPLALPDPSDRTLTQGQEASFTLPEASGGTSPYTYSVSGLPPGLAFTQSDRSVSGTPETNGVSSVTYSVTDSASPAATRTRTFTVTINFVPPVPSTPGRPRLTAVSHNSISLSWGTVAGATHYDARYRDRDAGGVGVPGDWSHTYDIRDTARTFTGLDSEHPLSIRGPRWQCCGRFGLVPHAVWDDQCCSGAPDAAGPVGPDPGTEGEEASFTLPEASGGTSPYAYSVSGLPSGLAFTESDRSVSGTPNTAGVSTVTYSVTDSASPAATRTQTFTVTINSAPTVPSTPGRPSVAAVSHNSISLGWGTVAGATHYDARYRDRDAGGVGVPGDWSQSDDIRDTAKTFPGLTPSTRYEFEVRAGNAVGDSAWSPMRYGTTNAAPASLTLPDPSDRTLTQGQAASFTLPAASGGTSPYTYSVSSLPSGLTFTESDRRVSGTPDTEGVSAVTYNVTDSASPAATRTQTFTVTITFTPTPFANLRANPKTIRLGQTTDVVASDIVPEGVRTKFDFTNHLKIGACTTRASGSRETPDPRITLTGCMVKAPRPCGCARSTATLRWPESTSQ